MALTERSRHKLFETFTGLVDDEQAVEEMLSYFPARDVEEPVTKDFLRAELQSEVGAVRTEVADVRTELQVEIGAVRLEIGELRTEMREGFATVRAEMHQMMRSTQAWFVGTGISLAGLMLAIARFG